MSIKNSIDTIGKRTRDVPACSELSPPTAPPRRKYKYRAINLCHLKLKCSGLWHRVFNTDDSKAAAASNFRAEGLY